MTEDTFTITIEHIHRDIDKEVYEHKYDVNSFGVAQYKDKYEYSYCLQVLSENLMKIASSYIEKAVKEQYKERGELKE